jgi:hypothetical protein
MKDTTQDIRETNMDKRKLGKKLCCANCNGKFFDFNQEVNTCPLCHNDWQKITEVFNMNILQDQQEYINYQSFYGGEEMESEYLDNLEQEEFTCFYDEEDTFA